MAKLTKSRKARFKSTLGYESPLGEFGLVALLHPSLPHRVVFLECRVYIVSPLGAGTWHGGWCAIPGGRAARFFQV